MDARLISDIQDTQKTLLDVYELALQTGDSELQDPKTFLNLMEALCVVKNNGAAHEQSIAIAKESASNYEEYQSIYAAELSKATSKVKKPKNTTEYKAFQTRLSEMKNSFQPDLDSDDDGQRPGTSGAEVEQVEFEELVMESQINPIDPLTKQRMTEPMRNKHCGHHYEKSSIQEAIKINRRLRCPVAGCGNKKFVCMNELILDEDFRMRLRNVVDMEDESEEVL